MKNLEADGHKCVYRDDQRLWKRICAWWLLPAHFLTTTTLALVLLMFVDMHVFLVDGEPLTKLREKTIKQSDMATLISLAVGLTRLIGGSCLSIAGWRMCFIILELTGAKLGEVDWVVQYGIPFLAWKRAAVTEDGAWLPLSMWLLFFLGSPHQFMAPVLTGAVSWIPTLEHATLKSPSKITTAVDGNRWRSHNDYSNNRYYEVIGATGLAAFASKSSFDTTQLPVFRRLVPSIHDIPINSMLGNITMPLFDIYSLDSISHRDEIGFALEMLEKVVGAGDYAALNLSRDWNPFASGTDSGRLTLVNESPYEPLGDPYPYPSPSIIKTTRWVVVAANFHTDCTQASLSDYWGSALSQIYLHPIAGSCFIFGRINFTAATLTCRNCPIVTNRVVEARLPTNITTWKPEPDPIVHDAVAFMPKILAWTKMVHYQTDPPIKNNLDGWTRGMLSISYQAAWNQLLNSWASNSPYMESVSSSFPQDTTSVQLPVRVLRASVVHWRIWVWLAVNLGLPASGIILGFLQAKTQAKTVQNPVIAALMMDTSGVLERDRRGLCNASDLDERDKKLGLRLVVHKDKTRSRCDYQHPHIGVQSPLEHKEDTNSNEVCKSFCEGDSLVEHSNT